MRIKLSTWLAIVALTIIICHLIWLGNFAGFDTVKGLKEASGYSIHSEEMIPYENVGDLLVADQKLFLLFEKNELLNVYTLDGTFLYGIQTEDCQNGGSKICYVDGKLYLAGKTAGIYVFQDKNLIALLPGTGKNMQIFDTVNNLEFDDALYHYEDRGNRIIRTDENGESIILQFPDGDSSIFIITLICMPLLFASAALEKRNMLSGKNIEKSKNNA